MEAQKGHIDWNIFLPVLALMLFSIAFVYSASAYIGAIRFGTSEKYFWNHSIRILAAIFTLITFAKIDYHIYLKHSKKIIFISLIPLILVFIIGEDINGAYRWIDIGPLSFQPSEFAKFALVIHIATLLTQRKEVIKNFRYGLMPILIWTGLICILIAAQPNFSTALVIFLIGLLLMFIGNTNLLHLLSLGAAGIALAIPFAISSPHIMQRISTYSGYASDTTSKMLTQAEQALIAIGNGGLIGVGPGQSRQSNLFLPESYSDYIFSIISEEYGFIGVLLLISTFIFIFWRGMLVAKKAPDDHGYFLAIGILITFAIYAFVSIAVNVGLLPETGLPLPFLSYGGTAVIFYAAAMGILLNISSRAGVYPREKE